MRPVRRAALVAALLSAILLSAALLSAMSVAAQAQEAADLSCGELWHERNAIYARNGYCFETERARAVLARAASRPMAGCADGRSAASRSCRCGNGAGAAERPPPHFPRSTGPDGARLAARLAKP
ncbi:MAG TPA: YARHG domain-containing protein [Methylosinus sp.]